MIDLDRDTSIAAPSAVLWDLREKQRDSIDCNRQNSATFDVKALEG